MAATHALPGYEVARPHRPDLILLDLHLPDFSGYDVPAQLKGDDVTREIPVVTVRADVSTAQVQRMREAGTIEYLKTPLQTPELLQLLISVLFQKETVD